MRSPHCLLSLFICLHRSLLNNPHEYTLRHITSPPHDRSRPVSTLQIVAY